MKGKPMTPVDFMRLLSPGDMVTTPDWNEFIKLKPDATRHITDHYAVSVQTGEIVHISHIVPHSLSLEDFRQDYHVWYSNGEMN